MQCPVCDNELIMTKNKVNVVGDNSPNEPTRVLLSSRYVCINPQCSMCESKSVIKGEEISLYDSSIQSSDVEITMTAKLCCGEIIAFIDESTYEIPNRTYAFFEFPDMDETLQIKCPICSRLHKFDVNGKTRLS